MQPTHSKNQKDFSGQVSIPKLTLINLVPKPEICFSIIGKTTIDGERVLNAECENEFEIDKWISYLEAMILYLRKSRLIRTNVLVTKMSDPQMASK